MRRVNIVTQEVAPRINTKPRIAPVRVNFPEATSSKFAKSWGYVPRATIIGNNFEVINPKTISGAMHLGKELAQSGYPINIDGNPSGLVRVISQAAQENGGEVFGISLQKDGVIPNGQFTEFESYVYEDEKQRRLLELGDIHITTSDVRDFRQVSDQIKELFTSLQRRNYYSPIYYPALDPERYYEHIMRNTNNYEILFEDLMLTIFPGVFPSNRFRSSKALGKIARDISYGKVVADICCGAGSIGIVAYDEGAKHVVLGDINPRAKDNTQYNIGKLGLDPSRIKVYESDVFNGIPEEYKGIIEVIFCSPPFFKEKFLGDRNQLMSAFLADGKEGGVIDRFLNSAKSYLTKNGTVFLVFSNKDPEHLQFLERSLNSYGYKWELCLIKNKGTIADTRVYKITI